MSTFSPPPGTNDSSSSAAADGRQQADNPAAAAAPAQPAQSTQRHDGSSGSEAQHLSLLIETLPLPNLEKQFLRTRWLEQLAWMDNKAMQAQRYYYALRLTTIIGGVIVPALVTLSVSVSSDSRVIVGAVTWVISLLVAISATVEEFFHFGERWRHYRRTAEQLKIEGWRYLQLTRPYHKLGYDEAYPVFAAKVEEISQREVNVYISEVVPEREETKERATGSPPNPTS